MANITERSIISSEPVNYMIPQRSRICSGYRRAEWKSRRFVALASKGNFFGAQRGTLSFVFGAALLNYRSYADAAQIFEKASVAFPDSALVYAGLGMAYYLGERYDESATALLRAVQLEAGSEHALNYLGATQMDTDSEPLPQAIEAVCSRADSQPEDLGPVTWCGALLFRKGYLSGDQKSSEAALAHLQHAIALAPRDPVANCILGRAYAWTEKLPEARQRLELCVRLRPDSAQDHYSLSRVYSELGLKQAARVEAAQTAKLDSQSQRKDTLAREFTADVLSVPTEGAKH